VFVGSGEELTCGQVCRVVQLEIQGHKFVVDLFVLALGGSDIVLGAQWLKTLGPILSVLFVLSIMYEICASISGGGD
jgi:hypothetical protein